MSRTHLRYLRFLLLGILSALPCVPYAAAQTGGVYDLTWNTIDGGGSTSTAGGAYSLGGTIGQPDAGAASGGTYSLVGGFWGAANSTAPIPPTPTQVVSRKLHGGTPYDINLPLSGNAGIECRTGGANKVYQVVLTFPGVVTFSSASVTSGTGSVASASGGGTNTVIVDLTGVTNAQRITVTLAGLSNGSSTGDLGVPMGVLVGDTTGNASVSASDIGQVKGQSGQPVTSTNFRNDVTASGGSINASDIGQVKAASGTQLP